MQISALNKKINRFCGRSKGMWREMDGRERGEARGWFIHEAVVRAGEVGGIDLCQTYFR